MNKTLALLALFSATGMALSFAAGSSFAEDPAPLPGIIVAAGEKPAPQTAPSDGAGDGDAGVLDPKTYPETPADVAACMKTWDAQTAMSKEEYEESCRRTLRYYPEKAN